jgi:hypothetical protein
MDWPYVHQRASQLGILKLFQKIQRKVKRGTKREKKNTVMPH